MDRQMEEIISEPEDYLGQTLHEFRLVFYSINKKQRQWLISHFQDYAWEGGLCIAHCSVSEMPKIGLLKSFANNEADVEFRFESTKSFENKDWTEWTEEDLEEILDTRLIGQEQFFSNIYFSEIGLDTKKAIFIDQNKQKYEVEFGKDSGVTKI